MTLNIVNNELQVEGDANDNAVTLRRDPEDPTTQFEVIADGASLGSVLLANFNTIVVNGQEGNDTILIDETNGAFTDTIPTTLNGDAGDDAITGGTGGETIAGGDGSDTLIGNGGDDRLTGEAGNDILLGGIGLDTLDGGADNDSLAGGPGGPGFEPHIGGPGVDTIVWNQGDGDDQVDGGDDFDTLVFNGMGGTDTLTVAAAAPAVTVTRVQGGIDMAVTTTEQLTVNGLGGDDVLTAGAGLNGLIGITFNGGDGNDALTGGDGGDTLNGDAGDDDIQGGPGLDTLDGGAGNDRLEGDANATGFEPHIGGPGNDTFVWDPGDGDDKIDGGDGNDFLIFNGASAANVVDTVTVTANAPRVTLFRNPGNIDMDIGTTEQLIVSMLGGNDSFQAGANLNGLITLTVSGGDGNDIIVGGDGPDSLHGGAGNDTITGGAGLDLLDGGEGNDSLTGGPGAGFEPHVGGPGDDLMVWNPGDGDDTIDGGDGNDTLIFNGGNGADVMTATANGMRVTFFRNPGSIDMDIGTTETLTVNGLDGDDTVTINPGLTGLIGIGIHAGAGADTVNTFASSTIQLNGNAGVDTLNFDAEGQEVTERPLAIEVGGVARATHLDVENVNISNSSNLPTITITSPTAEPTATASSALITLAGTATDNDGVTAVTWASDRGPTGAASGTTTWTAPNIPLLEGANVITVTARDADGNTATDTLTLTVEAFTYTLAEGSTGTFFDTDILIANTNAVPAPISIRYLKADGSTVEQTMTLQPTSRTTIAVDEIQGLEATEVSATVTSVDAVPLVVERTMRWDETNYGAHTEKAVDAPAKTWFFAEGSQGTFETFLLLANPNPVESVATVQFLPEDGAPVEKTFTVRPTSRLTVPINTIPEMIDRSFGMIVTFTEPGVAERAMYLGAGFNAGHESAGVTAPANDWFLAEGATGSFFTTFLLLANPNDVETTATITYLPDTGVAVTKTKTLQPRQRLTINIAGEDPALEATTAGMRVTSIMPILAERAQFWPFDPTQWYESHNSFGTTATSTKWGLAEGRVGTPLIYQTFILLANSDAAQAADVRVTFLRTNGTTLVKTFTVGASTRFTLHVNSMVPELADEQFGALVEVTNGIGIVVERAMYSDRQGVPFAAGTNAAATALP